MPIQQTPEQHGFRRTHIRVVREDGREFPNLFVAYRELLGTREELGYSEHQRMRATIRAGGQPRDSHGFMWRQVGSAAGVIGAAVAAIRWTDFTFGVEIECLAPFGMHVMREVLDQIGASNWRVVHDGSLNRAPGYEPMEVVSPVLQGETGLTKLREVMKRIEEKGCKVNNSCGMHVHVGVRGMQPVAISKIAVAFLNAEQHFDALVPPARRDGNRYCQSNVQRARGCGDTSLANVRSIREIAAIMNGGNSPQHYNPYRYYKLNFQSFVHHGTIEFRQHSGTVDAEKAAAWVRLITGFCADAAEKAVETIGDRRTLDQFLDQCADESAARYLRGRAARFAAATARRAA